MKNNMKETRMTKEQYNRNSYDPNVERLIECVKCGSEDSYRDSDEIIGYRDEEWIYEVE